MSKLGELVRSNIVICKEVALTAFSLQPTKERFDKLVELAGEIDKVSASLPSPAVDLAVKQRGRGEVIDDIASGSGHSGCSNTKVGDIEVCDREFDSSSATRDILEEEKIENQNSSSSQDDDLTKWNNTALGSCVSKSMMEDLVSIVESSRWHAISWKTDWTALKNICRKYLLDQSKKGSIVEELDNDNYENDDCVEKDYVNKPVKMRQQEDQVNPERIQNLSSQQIMVTANIHQTEEERPAEINKVCLYFSLVSKLVINYEIVFGQKSRGSLSTISVYRSYRFDSVMPRLDWRFKSPAISLVKPTQVLQLQTRPGTANHFAPMLSTLNMQPKVILKIMKVKSFACFKKSKGDTKSVPTANHGQLQLQSPGVTKTTSTTQSAPMSCAEEHNDMENQCTHGNLSMIFLQ